MGLFDVLSSAVPAAVEYRAGRRGAQQEAEDREEGRLAKLLQLSRQQGSDALQRQLQEAQLSKTQRETELLGTPNVSGGAPPTGPQAPVRGTPEYLKALEDEERVRAKFRPAPARVGTGASRPDAATARMQMTQQNTFKAKETVLNNLKDAIARYRDQLTATGVELMPGDAKSLLTGAYSNLKLLAKEAANLGALTGPDVMILEELVNNPASAGSAFQNVLQGGGRAESMLKQLGQYESIIEGQRNRLREQFGAPQAKQYVVPNNRED